MFLMRVVLLFIPLHSNMFLLILNAKNALQAGINFTFQYVSINTIGSLAGSAAGLFFTFQYVSINTGFNRGFREHGALYIPICFY